MGASICGISPAQNRCPVRLVSCLETLPVTGLVEIESPRSLIPFSRNPCFISVTRRPHVRTHQKKKEVGSKQEGHDPSPLQIQSQVRPPMDGHRQNPFHLPTRSPFHYRPSYPPPVPPPKHI